MPAPTTITMSSAAMTRYGAILPTKTSRGRNGITASCSMVPAWRSRTTPSAVATVPTKTRMMPHRPGIMITAVRRLGVEEDGTCTDAARRRRRRLRRRRRRSRPPACASARPRSAAWVANSSVPSRSSVGAAPAARRDDGDDGLAAAQRVAGLRRSPPGRVAHDAKLGGERGGHRRRPGRRRASAPP